MERDNKIIMAEENDNKVKELSNKIDELEKQLVAITEALDPFKLAPRVMDVAIQSRAETTGYVDATYTLDVDVMLQLEWQGRRYLLPAFEL